MSNALAGALHTCLLDKNGFKTSSGAIRNLIAYQSELSKISENTGLIDSIYGVADEGLIIPMITTTDSNLGIGY